MKWTTESFDTDDNEIGKSGLIIDLHPSNEQLNFDKY